MLTFDPGFAVKPPAGFCAMTRPAATVGWLAEVTVPSVSCAAMKLPSAADCVVPSTLGTGTGSGPVEMTKSTAVPGGTVVPGAGDCEITLPSGMVALDTRSTL